MKTDDKFFKINQISKQMQYKKDNNAMTIKEKSLKKISKISVDN